MLPGGRGDLDAHCGSVCDDSFGEKGLDSPGLLWVRRGREAGLVHLTSLLATWTPCLTRRRNRFRGIHGAAPEPGGLQAGSGPAAVSSWQLRTEAGWLARPKSSPKEPSFRSG